MQDSRAEQSSLQLQAENGYLHVCKAVDFFHLVKQVRPAAACNDQLCSSLRGSDHSTSRACVQGGQGIWAPSSSRLGVRNKHMLINGAATPGAGGQARAQAARGAGDSSLAQLSLRLQSSAWAERPCSTTGHMAYQCDSELKSGKQAKLHSSWSMQTGRQNNLWSGARCWKLPRGPCQHFRRGAAWPETQIDRSLGSTPHHKGNETAAGHA